MYAYISYTVYSSGVLTDPIPHYTKILTSLKLNFIYWFFVPNTLQNYLKQNRWPETNKKRKKENMERALFIYKQIYIDVNTVHNFF